MKEPRIHHPIHAVIEDLRAAGRTPRLQIDARRRDVEVPESIRRTWQARLVIDLDPSYPLALEQDEHGLSADLAFSGVVSRCRFSWASIYAVLDRATGRGILVDAHLPPAELPAALSWEPPRARPRLSAVPSARSVEPNGLAPDDPGATLGSDPDARPDPDSDARAKERRAKFRVIDGGR